MYRAPLSALVISLLILLVSPSVHAAQLISLDEILSASSFQSYDLKLARIESRSARVDVKEQRVDFFPQLRAQYNNEYMHSLGNSQTTTPVVAVGNTSIPSFTRFQNALSLTATYTLTDFAVRNKNLSAAQKHARAAEITLTQQQRDMKLKLIDLYAEALANYKGLKAREKSLAVYQELYSMKKRLLEAVTISRVELAEQSLKVLETSSELAEFKQQYVQNLKDLGSYTHIVYDPETIGLLEMNDEQPLTVPFVAETTPEYKFYQLEIQRKVAELQALSLQRLPQIGLYSYYLWVRLF